MLPPLPHWKCTVAYQELADELWDGEGQLCDIFHRRGIGSCRPINPVYCYHVHQACVQYGTDKPFNPGRFSTQSPVESSEMSMLGAFQSRAYVVRWCWGFTCLTAACQALVESWVWTPIAGICSSVVTPSRTHWFRREPAILMIKVTSAGLRLRSQSCCGATTELTSSTWADREHLDPALLPTGRKSLAKSPCLSLLHFLTCRPLKNPKTP